MTIESRPLPAGPQLTEPQLSTANTIPSPNGVMLTVQATTPTLAGQGVIAVNVLLG